METAELTNLLHRYERMLDPLAMQFPILTRSLFELQEKHSVDVVVVGGQGTFDPATGNYSTEWPDRGCSVEHAISVEGVRARGGYDLVVPSGGFTQKTTPDLSEARSFINMWRKPHAFPNCPVLLDEVALDSAENLLYSLMLVRLILKGTLGLRIPIARVLFYTQWQFKIRRMNATAQRLGILSQFYFQAYTDEKEAWASDRAKDGEMSQVAKLEAADDFLLLGDEWEKKRFSRFQIPSWAEHPDAEIRAANKRAIYDARHAHLRKAFPATFAALQALRQVHSEELLPLISAAPSSTPGDIMKQLADSKLRDLQNAFREEVICPKA